MRKNRKFEGSKSETCVFASTTPLTCHPVDAAYTRGIVSGARVLDTFSNSMLISGALLYQLDLRLV